MNNVIDFIPIGSHSRPTSREELVMLTGMSDRSVREEINHLKREYPIVNMGAGYYVADDPDDPNLKAYIHAAVAYRAENPAAVCVSAEHRRFYKA